jgi:hypothetical protein
VPIRDESSRNEQQMKSIPLISAQHLQAIGLVTVNFAKLENAIEWFIWSLIGQDEGIGLIITTELSFKNLVALLSSLSRVKIANAEVLAELDRALKQALQADEKRNIILHSLWAQGQTRDTVTRIKKTAKLSKGLQHQVEEMTAEDITSIANFIDNADLAIESLRVHYFHPQLHKK